MQKAVRGIVSVCMVSSVNLRKGQIPKRLSRRRGYRGPHRRGNRDLWDFCDLVQFLIVNRDSDATEFLTNAYEGARPWRSGVLHETGGEIRVENGLGLLREDRVQSVRA